jgi:uncharacterized protein (TIGR02246 family)
VVSTYTFPGPNLTPAETWASGVRTPYGLAFSPTGELWEVEHGPRGGDELNLIEKGKNYGWPLVSYGQNYNGVPIASPDTRPDLAKPVLYWVPVIAPGNLMFYRGTQTFPQWNGSGFVSGLATKALNRIVFDGHGGAKTAERWDVGQRIRDVEEGPDGSLWMLEDANPGALIHVTPKYETNPTPDEALKAFNGYDAWCANYRLDRQEGAIIYRAEMDLDPNEGSDEVRRYFKFSPDGRLVITFNDSTSKSQTYAFTRIYERVATDSDQRQTGTHEAEVEALRVVEIAEEHAWVLKDFEKAVASYADDAVVMNPNAPAQTGKEQIRAGMKPLFDDPGFTTKYEITGVELAQSGELGYTRGTYSGTSTDPVTKKIVSERGKWLTIRRKQADGAWKIIVDTASSDLPLPAPAK